MDFSRRLSAGFGLTTANIFYRRPDHLWLLQEFVWQDYDIFPDFPALHKFLDFWEQNLDGPVHSVQVSHSNLLMPTEIISAKIVSYLN